MSYALRANPMPSKVFRSMSYHSLAAITHPYSALFNFLTIVPLSLTNFRNLLSIDTITSVGNRFRRMNVCGHSRGMMQFKNAPGKSTVPTEHLSLAATALIAFNESALTVGDDLSS
mmetsp:Transcript_18961/g.47657  ORF Transcript_18961/g.47657 Transcript_18961/m.47657 type:complete len:116 (+) Transcript_18961:1276-1623(+)